MSDEPTMVPEVDPLLGVKLGEYEILRPIGEGGMGIVYEGIHTAIHKRVAIKVIRAALAQDATISKRMVAEAQAINAVRHRNIVDVHAHGLTADGRPYLVMEFLEGSSLGDVLARQRRLDYKEACALLLEVCGPLAAAHRAGVVHRDLKPSNVFICVDDDGGQFLKLLDFGLAKRGGGATSSTLTAASIVVGTPDYMSPEQARSQPTEARTDVYALGVMAFELLAGRLPYQAPTPVDVIMKHLTAPVPSLLDVAPEVPDELAALVARMMAKDIAERPDIEEVRAQLREVLGQGRPSSPGMPMLRFDTTSTSGLHPIVRHTPAPDRATPVPPGTGSEQTWMSPSLTPAPSETSSTSKTPVETMAVEAPAQPANSTSAVTASKAALESTPAPSRRGLFAAVGVGVLALVVGGVWLASGSGTPETPEPVDAGLPVAAVGPLVPLPLVAVEPVDAGAPEQDAGTDVASVDAGVATVDAGVKSVTTPKKKRIPTVDELQARIEKLEHAKVSDPTAAPLLRKYKDMAERAATDKERLDLSAKLDAFQKTYGAR